ncbi:MAG: translocation/assembly module TamB domain-containing protein [Rhodothermales bacterium]
MSPRRLLHIPRHAVRIAVLILLAGVLLFFALTRTQVGRDGLRKQIEQRFANTFEGRIEIGQLKGNLAQNLFASDVRLYDPGGRLVLEVDSLVARPSWRALFSRRISVGSLTLIRPTFYFFYQDDNTWNVADVFRQHTTKVPSDADPWSFDSADLHFVDGTILTRHGNELPSAIEQGWLFNYAGARMEDIQMRTTLEWNADAKLIDLLHFSGVVTDIGLAIEGIQGQLLIENDGLFLNQFSLAAGRTYLRIDGSIDHLDSLLTGAFGDAVLDAEVHPSRFDFGALQRLFPRLLLADILTSSAHVRGPFSHLVIDSFSAGRGRTLIAADGRVRGIPDSLDFELAIGPSTVASEDVRALLPATSLPDLSPLGLLSLEGTARGVAYTRPAQSGLRLRTGGEARIYGELGHLTLDTLSVIQESNKAIRYAFDLEMDSLDVGRFTADAPFASSLNGRVTVEGRGLTLDSLNTTLKAEMRASHMAGRHADTVHVDASLVGRRLSTTAFARQGRGRLFANAVLNLTRQPSYSLGLISRRFDLGPLLAQDSLRSSLNTQWTLDGAGTTWDDLRGELTLTFDSSEVTLKKTRRIIPPHRSVLTVNAPGSSKPRLDVSGDAFSVRLLGEAPMKPLQALSALWRQTLTEALAHQQAKTYQRKPTLWASSHPFVLTDAPSPEKTRLREEARTALLAAGLDSLALDVDIEIKRSDVLSALLPMLPSWATDTRATLHLTASDSLLRLDASLAADSLQALSLRADTYTADLHASLRTDVPVEQSLLVSFDLNADSLLFAGQVFRAPALAARYDDRHGQLTLTSDRNNTTGPVRLDATLDLLLDRNRLTLQDFYLALGEYVWQNPERQTLDLYADATVVPGLSIENQPPDGSPLQRVTLRGTLSRAEQDTFFVEAEEIGLRQWSEVLAWKRTLGGQLNGRLAFTQGIQPELTGSLTVDALSMDDRVLGHLDASSRYLPESPEIALQATVTPVNWDELHHQPLDGFREVENRLQMNGTFRLPRTDEQGRTNDPGMLDLSVEVARADAFFFEYILGDVDQVEGAISGTGTIGGTFAHPLFNADLTFSEGRFDVPEFNLHYTLEGPVRVDEQGITLDDVRLGDPTEGSATVSGLIAFNDYRFFSFDLAATLNDLQIIDVPSSRHLPFYGTIWASGDATLTGPLYNASLQASNITTHENSEVFIPIKESETALDRGFIIFTDSTGRIPDIPQLTRRDNILDKRPAGERTLTEGLDMDLNIFAPQGSTVRLVIDPLLGDVINAEGSGRIQLQRQEGEFSTFGSMEVQGGDYLFTAGEVFVRRFLIDQGTITWDGDPLNPSLDIEGAYETRAYSTGLPSYIANDLSSIIPLIVQLHITGEINSLLVDLDLAVDRSTREAISNTPVLESYLNQPDRSAQHATSVLLTNSFVLTTEGDVLAGSAFNSVSQLVSSQLNRYLSQVLPNADFRFGVQGEEAAKDLDVTVDLAIRLLNDRLVIRGQGVYRGLRPGDNAETASQQGLQGEFVVEVRLSPSVSVEVFYRREGDVLSETLLTSTTGAGLSYHTQFPTWRKLLQRIFGGKKPPSDVASDSTKARVAEGHDQ